MRNMIHSPTSLLVKLQKLRTATETIISTVATNTKTITKIIKYNKYTSDIFFQKKTC